MDAPSKAIEKALDFERRWSDYTTTNNLPPVAPALLIQVKDGKGSSVSETDLAEVLRKLHATWPTLRPDQVVHCFNGVPDKEWVPGWPVSYREPSTISADLTTRVVYSKTALNTGWDCPRGGNY